MITRRRFLQTLPAAAAAAQSLAAQTFAFPHLRKKEAPPAAPVLVFFGTDTGPGVSKGIYQSRFNNATGQLTPPVLAAATDRPTFLALSGIGSQRHLYAVNAGTGAQAAVSSFAVEPRTGALKPLNHVSSAGDGPCYVSVDATGRSAFAADYNGSSIASYRILPGGTLSPPVEQISFKDPKFGPVGPNAARQTVPHPHCCTVSPDNRFILVNDLGTDHIAVFAFDPDTARLGPPTLFTNDRPGSGPRHVAFHPNGRWVYALNELDSTLDHFLWTTTSSRTAPQGLLVKTGNGTPMLAPDFTQKNTAAEVTVSGDGRFVYGSNRGENSIVCFAVNATDGSLTLAQRISCGGKGPRHFTLDPTGRWILCGNQDSASVTVFRRDEATGQLSGPVQTLPIDSPMFSLFA